MTFPVEFFRWLYCYATSRLSPYRALDFDLRSVYSIPIIIVLYLELKSATGLIKNARHHICFIGQAILSALYAEGKILPFGWIMRLENKLEVPGF